MEEVQTQQQGVESGGESGGAKTAGLMDKMRTAFKPSLLTRIIMEGGGIAKQGRDIDLAKDAAAIMGVGAWTGVQEGGAASPDIPEGAFQLPEAFKNADRKTMAPFTDNFFARAMLRIFILTVSMYLAARIMGSTYFQENIIDKIDSSGMFNNPDADAGFSFKDKYKILLVVMGMFVALTIVINWALSWLPYIMFYIYFRIITKPGEKVKELAQISFQYIFDEFIAKEMNGNMKFYLSIQSYAIWGLLIFFVVYAFFVESFVMTMLYPMTNEKEEAGELPWVRKFLIHHMMVVIFAILFMVGLFVIHFAPQDIIGIVYTIFFICVYSLLLCTLVLLEVRRKPLAVRLILFVALFVLVVANFRLLLY